MVGGRHEFLAELRGLLWLAAPIVVNQLGQVGMSVADTVMVGPLGPEPLAAGGLGSAVHHFGLTIGMGVVMGMAPLVSQAFGAGNRLHCRRVFVQGVWVALLVSLPITLLCLLGERVSLWLGQDPVVSALTGGYLMALAASIAPALLFIAARQYLEGMGHAIAPMVITFVGLAVNIGANRLFIYGAGDVIPAMGVEGAGWATTVVRFTMLLAIVVFLATHRELHPLRGVRIRVRPALLRSIFVVGVPVGVQFGLEVGLFAFASIMMGWMGATELAAHQVTINIASVTFMVALGASLAGSIRVGQHIGAGRPAAMRRAVIGAYTLTLGFMACCAVLFLSIPRPLMLLYTPHEGIVGLGVRLLLLAAAFQIFDGAQVCGMAVLRGAADTRAPMLIAMVGYWFVGVPTAYVLGFHTSLGPVGIWMGLSVGLAAVALMLLLRVRRVLWRDPVERAAAAVPA